MIHLSHFFNQAIPYLSNDLVDQEALHKIQTWITFFKKKELRTSLLGFEMPLSGSKKWIDFLLQINLRSSKTSQIAPLFHSFPGFLWKRFASYLNGPLIQKYGWLALEIDLGSRSHLPTLPNFFIGAPQLQKNSFISSLEETSSHFKRKKFSKKMIQQMEKYQNLCASSGVEIFGFGFMLARPLNSIRMGTFSPYFIRSNFIHEHLSKAGYNYEIKVLISLFETMKPWIEKCGLGIDLHEKIDPRIGIELTAKKGQWENLLSVLESGKWISKEKKKGCLDWIGSQYSVSSNPKWVDIFHRTLNHVKLVFTPPNSIEIKIYFRFKHLHDPLLESQYKPSSEWVDQEYKQI